MWQIPIELHRRIPDLPIICDPSHIGGRRDLIAPLCQQGLDLGADGLINPAAERQVPDSYVYRGADDTVVLYQSELKTPLHLGTSPRYHRK